MEEEEIEEAEEAEDPDEGLGGTGGPPGILKLEVLIGLRDERREDVLCEERDEIDGWEVTGSIEVADMAGGTDGEELTGRSWLGGTWRGNVKEETRQQITR